jgi:AcrR family transcriptional regulator
MIGYWPAADDYDGLSIDEIAGRLNLSRATVFRLEHDALAKMAIGLALVELVGRKRAESVLVALRRKPISKWRAALIEARDSATKAVRP